MIEELKGYSKYKDSGVSVPRTRQAGAWYKPDSVKIGYEISFNRYFYKPNALRSLEDIRADLIAVEREAKDYSK